MCTSRMTRSHTGSFAKPPCAWRASLLAGSLALALNLVPARVWAVPGGQIDVENRFPNVCMFYARNAEGRIGSCSGTLIHPRVVLTAGHCTEGLLAFAGSLDQLFVSFDPDNAFLNEPRAVAAVLTIPEFNANSLANDIGLVILAEPVLDIEPARLPPRDLPEPYLDMQLEQGNLRWRDERADMWIAGYGTTVELAPFEIVPPDGARRFGLTKFKALLPPHWLLITQHEAQGIDLPGSCFGDSGGPTFFEDPDTGELVLITVTSFTGQCMGFGGLQRVDNFNVLDFIHSVLDAVENGMF